MFLAASLVGWIGERHYLFTSVFTGVSQFHFVIEIMFKIRLTSDPSFHLSLIPVQRPPRRWILKTDRPMLSFGNVENVSMAVLICTDSSTSYFKLFRKQGFYLKFQMAAAATLHFIIVVHIRHGVELRHLSATQIWFVYL